MWRRVALATGSMLLLSACSGQQSALDPHGPDAEHIARLIWLFTGITGAIWFAVMVVLAIALLRRVPLRPDPLVLDVPAERRSTAVVSAAVIGTALTVIALAALSFTSQRRLFAHENPAVNIKVTGLQWWWNVEYEGDTPAQGFTTANEIYVPVGKPVTVKLNATDVIHSFWVPSLMGKMDLIPGQQNQLQFTASKPGIYRGQCAEFCGWQHAHMGLVIVALPPPLFDNWRNSQAAPSIEPDNDQRKKGADVFMSKACFMCHTIRGTEAGSRVGPDLTHFASRQSIASATLPMSRGSIAAWVLDPQGIKPGTNMPNVSLAPDELDAIVSYLEGLR
jgi:cytochrome c oxidase subunit II